ncbi:TlyA family RNA methyltransferase [Prosthecobacter vanneervenii]|uniref:23S rRNA (Cytidine1920-2'-O)/16S rRNA (Cytidine1409-2'-O)-methyltransferase n=1 Tax=Prosthecobacter vanneervenii TaxID=48466 RepID=A0A7W8DLQ8_9BACT|nr:TlyA family RNA methyltransferase [Prosthecobacter vanneervenii]MBB5034310.1 23S rRNA (cytidine1920-2'-O)/16S rRNA (cytidine1409-2'-O)-methyltransferase [Prosthecobacter vanneervenii]
MPRERLDLALLKLGIVPSREQAKRLIMAGEVSVMGKRITQPGWLVKDHEQIVVRERPKFVSRGGLKLEGALQHFGIDVAGMTSLDVGASTGGFTDCLLQRGAVKVFAYDVGTNQLAWKLRSDPRVVSREQFNLRHMRPEDVGQDVDILVADLSFISLTLVLPAVLQVLRPGGHAVVLIKPQFELSREEIGAGGIVREPELHAKACARIEDFVRSQPHLEWRGMTESTIQGTDGNREFLAWIGKLQ